jgi:uncharacterized protein YukE
MATITVDTAMLREKARFIRELLAESKAAHQQLWSQITTQASLLPRDLYATHSYANGPWNKAVEALYQDYYQLALNMEAAADAYDRGEKDFQISFTPSN